MNAVLFVSNFIFLELFLHTCMFLIDYFTHNFQFFTHLIFMSLFIYTCTYNNYMYSNNFDE